MRVTIRDVAYRAGVSNNTVSRVLNDRPDVSPATRVRIQNVIEELGYRPNSLARSLLRRESRTVGLVVTDCTNPNTARQIRAVQQTMAAGGYAVLIFDTQEDPLQGHLWRSARLDHQIWRRTSTDRGRCGSQSAKCPCRDPIIGTALQRPRHP